MKKYLILALLIIGTTHLSAKTITVTSLPDLQTAINNAKPGDVILLADGTYTANADITISIAGIKSNPITISALHQAKAEISGSGGFVLLSPAAYVIIKWFTFTHSASKAKTSAGTSFCRFTENIFETPGNGEDLTIAGSDHEIDHNIFQNKNAMGRFLAIRGAGSQIAERLWIHHNSFKSHKDQGGANGTEAFQFGLSGFSLSSSNSIVEFNLFEDCAGENELISVKASAVTLRYNTIRKGGGPAASISGPYTNATWEGNIIFHTKGEGDMPKEGFNNTNPELVKDAGGTYHLGKKSPAIKAATGKYAQYSYY